MKKTRRIRKILCNVPDISVSDELNAKLKCDVNLKKIEKRSVIRGWFAPSGGAFSIRRVAYAAAIAIVCLVPLSFGAAKIIKKFVVQEYKATYTDEHQTKSVENNTVTVSSTTSSTTYGIETSIKGVHIISKEDARKAEEEMIQLIKEGKAEKSNGGTYKAVLPTWGEVIYETRSLPMSVLVSENRDEKIKEMYDEIESLRKAGKYESVFEKEVEKENGSKTRYYMEHFTLSTGEIVSFYHGSPAIEGDKE